MRDLVAAYRGGEAVDGASLAVHEQEGWWVAVCASEDGEMQSVSFVNSVATQDGGSHVTAAVDETVKNLLAITRKKNKARASTRASFFVGRGGGKIV